MDSNLPFRPAGSTVVIGAQTGTAPPATFADGPVGGGDVGYLVWNPGSIDSWLGYGPSSTAAQANAIIPLIGAPRQALPVPGGSLQVFTLAPRQFFSGITQLGSCSVYVTPGYGT
jgi:hypothetical protein